MREALILFVVLVTNPLGFVSGTDELSQQTFLLLAAPFYRLGVSYELCWRPCERPDAAPFYWLNAFHERCWGVCMRSDAAAPITVIMIDEQTLAKAESGYPLDDFSLTTLITTVTHYCAAALFVDLILGDPRPGERPLPEDLRRALSQEAPKDKDCPHKTQVYLADIPPKAEPSEASMEGTVETAAEQAGGSDEPDDGDSHLVHASLREGSLRLPVRWKQPGYAYPLRLRPPTGLPLGQEAKGGRWVTSEGELPSPALQLYRDLSKDHAAAHLPEVMVVGWGWKQPRLDGWYDELVRAEAPHDPWLCRLVRPDQRPFYENYFVRWLSAAATVLEELFLRMVSPAGRWCGIERGDPAQPYYFPLTISGASLLVRPGADEAERHAKVLKAAIENRAVLIGQNATAASDRIVSPVNGVVPGIILHAQALDNLLLWGDQVWQSLNGGDLDPEDKPMSNERWTTFTAIVVLGALMSVLRNFYGFGRMRALVVAIVAGGVFILWMVKLFYLAPINWIGVLVFLLWETPLQLVREDEPEAAAEHS